MNKRIGENIKYFRKQKGLTQKELGEKAGMADSAVRRYESGRFIPKDENLSKIAAVLGVSTFQLKMRGIEKTKEWKYALTADEYLKSLGIDVYYELLDPDTEEDPTVYLQGEGISIDMSYKAYEGLKKRLAAYALHLINRINTEED